MGNNINYRAIISELTLLGSRKNGILLLLDDYAKKESSKAVFCNRLIQEILRTKFSMNFLKPEPIVKQIASPVDGYIRHIDPNAKENQPYFIISKEVVDVANILLVLNSIDRDKEEMLELSNQFQQKGIYLVFGEPLEHLGLYQFVDLWATIQKVKKGQVLGEIKFYSFSEEAKKMLSIHSIAQEYFDNLLERYDNDTLPKKHPKNVIPPDKPIFLKDIFLEKFKYKYPDIIKELAEDQCEEYPSPFIRIEGDKTTWETGITYSFSYLAGLFGALLKLGWIKEKKEIEFMQIARDTFHIEVPFSRTAFQKMKSRGLDEAFINPFEGIFKRIK